MTQRQILLVDCDQFFVQCARLADPDGAGRAPLLLVGGSAEGRGVVTSASYETRSYGVHSGMPTAQALRLCPEAQVVPVPRELCGRKSQEIREVLGRFTPQVEPASIDEAYLDLSGTDRLYRHVSLEERARRVQTQVLEDCGIQVSIGGGTNRWVAKLAASRAKPAGVFVVAPGEERSFLAGHALSDLPGVGPVFAAELKRRGWVRVSDALSLEVSTLRDILGNRRGEWLFARIHGLDDSPVQSDPVSRSRSRDVTFPHDVDDDSELSRKLRHLAHRLGQDLRAEENRVRTVTVRVRDYDFRSRQASKTLRTPIETDGALIVVAQELLARLRAQRPVPVRLLGIGVSNWVDRVETGEEPSGGTGVASEAQLALFPETEGLPEMESDRERHLSRVTDALRKRYGGRVILTGDLLEPDPPG